LSTVFLGTSEFAAEVLTRLAGSDAHRPALVLTRPDRPSGRGRRLTSPLVATRARELGIALEQPSSVNDPEAGELIARAGRSAGGGGEGGEGGRQTVIVCAFGALIKEPLLSEHEILNVHPSLLPRWRGAAPVERAIMAGDAQTGVSIMRLTAGLDSGPVCLTAGEAILPDDSYGSLAPRLAQIGGELLLRALDQAPPFLEQPTQGITYAEKIAPEDRLLDPARPAADLERVVRALHPHIGARLALADGTLLGVHRAALIEPGPHPGDAAGDVAAAEGRTLGADVVVRDGRLLLECSPGVLQLIEVQPPGGRAMDAASYLRGHSPPGRR
jgi:methionyl-tRNA formyltransferase